MSESPAGKGDKRRSYDRKGYDESKLWVNLDKKKLPFKDNPFFDAPRRGTKQYGEPVNHKIDWDEIINSLPEAFSDNYEGGGE